MNSKQFLESTTSGSVATVATPVGKTQTRGKGVYPNEKGGNLLTGKKTNKKFANSNPMKEAKLDEEDVIIVPGQGNRIKPGFIPRKADRTDHEVEMALSDLFQSAKNAKQVYELIKDIPETVGIEGWVQEKIIKAADYLNTVREYLEHKQVGEVNEATKFTSYYDWKEQAKSSGYTITRQDDKLVALNKQGKVVGKWSQDGKFLSGKAPRPGYKRDGFGPSPADSLGIRKQGVAEGAPELLKKEMPLHRHAEKLLAQNGVSKDDSDYHHHLGNTIKHLRQFGNIDLINKSDEQGVAEGEIERKQGDLEPWAYWTFPHRVAKKLHQIYKGSPISKKEIIQLWKDDGPDRWTKFMFKPDVDAILSTYQQMSDEGPMFNEGYRILPNIDQGIISPDDVNENSESRDEMVWVVKWFNPVDGASNYRGNTFNLSQTEEVKKFVARKRKEGNTVAVFKDKFSNLQEEIKPKMAEGSIKDLEDKIKSHDKRKTDREQADDPYVAHELHSHNLIRKQLLDKRKRAQTAYQKKIDAEDALDANMRDSDNDLRMMDKDEDLTMEDNTKPAKQQSVDRIIKDTIMTDQISKDREGHYIFRKGYYYRPSGVDPTSWARSISKRLQEVGINNTVVDSGDIWKPFKGGASVKAQSHYYAKIKVDNTMAEGIVGKVLGGAALLAALWGIGQNQANQVYDNSPQLQTLIKYHQMATQQGDQAKIQELERRIENHKTRLSVGKGEVMGPDDKPIVPSFESSIMKGLQREDKDPCWDDYKQIGTKKKGNKTVPNCVPKKTK